MMNRISGAAFDVRMGFVKIHFENFTLGIEDGSTTAMDGILPNGTIPGEKKASGKATMDIANFMLMSAAAALAGSWDKLPPFPIDAFAKGEGARGTEGMHVHAHGCKLRLASVLNIDPKSTDKSTVEIEYDVTSPDFVWINGTPYADSSSFSII